MTAPAEISLLGAAVSVLLPITVGLAALAAITGPRLLGKTERLGLAYPLGAVLITAPLYGLAYAGARFTRLNFIAVAGTVLLLCLGIALRRRRPAPALPPPRANPPGLGWVLPAALSAVALCTLLFVVFEILHRPLSPADSFTVWAMRARVWAARGTLVLNPFDPFYLGRAFRPDYPPYASLLQTWTAVWVGGWNDVIINLPWACYGASALLFVFAALSRQLPRAWAWCGACVFATIPLCVVHVALAGDADLIIAVQFAVAVVAVYLWASEAITAYLVIGLLFAVSMPFIKLEGVPLLVAWAAGVVMQLSWLRRGGRRWWLVAALALMAAAFVSRNFMLKHLLTTFRWHPEAVVPLLRSLMGAGNFHFLWPLFFVTGLITLRQRWKTPLAWLFATVAAPLLPFCGVFLFTGAAVYAVDRTAASRLFLQLVPAAACFVVLAAGSLTSTAVPELHRRMRPWKRVAAGAALVLLTGLVGVTVRRVQTAPQLHWDLPSSDWRTDLQPGGARVLRYIGPPFDVHDSAGVAVTLAPGIDAGPLAIDWRRRGDGEDSRVFVRIQRQRPFVFLHLAGQETWAGRITSVTLTMFAELAHAVVAIDIPGPGLGAAVWSAWRSFCNPEILSLRTVHFVEGTELRGVPLALLAGGLWVAIVLIATLAARARLGLHAARRVILCTLALWTLCSVRFAWDLFATFRMDEKRFTDAAENARVDTLNAEFATLVAAVQQVIPADAPITFTSQFHLYLERAQYAFYPRPVVNWIRPLPLPTRPQYEVLFWPKPGQDDVRQLRILAVPSKGSAIARLNVQ
jgi:hypothetical protein